MRSIKYLGLSLAAVFLLYCGCSGISPTANVSVPDVRLLPNMGQQITPLAPKDSRFEPLNPDLSDHPDLAGRAGGHHRGESGSQDPAGSDQRVQPRLQHQRARRDHTGRTRMSTCSSTTFRRPRRSRSKWCKIPNTYNGIVFDPSGTGLLRGRRQQ